MLCHQSNTHRDCSFQKVDLSWCWKMEEAGSAVGRLWERATGAWNMYDAFWRMFVLSVYLNVFLVEVDE